MLRRSTHMTIVFVVTRVMNVWYQTSQASVTSSSPLCDSLWQFASFSRQIASILWTKFPPSPILLSLYNCSVFFQGQFTTSFHALFHMTFFNAKTKSPRSTNPPVLLLILWVLTPHFFWGDRCPSEKQNGLLFSVCAPRITSFLLFYFRHWPTGNFSSLSHSLSTAAFAYENFHRSTEWLSDLNHFFAVWSSRSFGGVLPKRFLVDSWASTMHARFSEFVGFAIAFSMLVRTLRRLQLAGHSGFHWKFQLFPCVCFLNGFLELLIFRIKKTDACTLSRIVELWFLDRSLPFFLSLSCFWHSGPNFWQQMIAPCGCLNLCRPSPGPHISVRRLSIESVELRQTEPRLREVSIRITSIFQLWSTRLCCNTSKVVCVVLLTSMSRSVIHHCVCRLRPVRHSSKINSALFASFGVIADTLISSRQLNCSISWIRQISWSIDVPKIIDATSLHPRSYRLPWRRPYISVELKMFLRSACKAWLSVQRDGGRWSLPKWTRNHLVPHPHPEVSLEDVFAETLLILPVNLDDLLFESGGPVSRWMFSFPDLLQQISVVHLRLGIWIVHFVWEILLLLHWVFFE